jgi:hypothetical protein
MKAWETPVSGTLMPSQRLRAEADSLRGKVISHPASFSALCLCAFASLSLRRPHRNHTEVFA